MTGTHRPAQPSLREILTAIANGYAESRPGVRDLAAQAIGQPDPLRLIDLDVRLRQAVAETSRDAQGRWWEGPGSWAGPAPGEPSALPESPARVAAIARDLRRAGIDPHDLAACEVWLREQVYAWGEVAAYGAAAIAEAQAAQTIPGGSGGEPDSVPAGKAGATAAGGEPLIRLLLRAAAADEVDLGSQISIEVFLMEEGVATETIARLTDDDLDEVRRRLQRRGMLLDPLDRVAEAIEDSGFAPLVLWCAIGGSLGLLARLLHSPAQAAVSAVAGPESSAVAGLLVALVPVLIAVLFMAAATRGAPVAADEEAFGDTTGFGERER